MNRSAWILGVWIAVVAFIQWGNPKIEVTKHVVCYQSGDSVQCGEPILAVNGGR